MHLAEGAVAPEVAAGARVYGVHVAVVGADVEAVIVDAWRGADMVPGAIAPDLCASCGLEP